MSAKKAKTAAGAVSSSSAKGSSQRSSSSSSSSSSNSSSNSSSPNKKRKHELITIDDHNEDVPNLHTRFQICVEREISNPKTKKRWEYSPVKFEIVEGPHVSSSSYQRSTIFKYEIPTPFSTLMLVRMKLKDHKSFDEKNWSHDFWFPCHNHHELNFFESNVTKRSRHFWLSNQFYMRLFNTLRLTRKFVYLKQVVKSSSGSISDECKDVYYGLKLKPLQNEIKKVSMDKDSGALHLLYKSK